MELISTEVATFSLALRGNAISLLSKYNGLVGLIQKLSAVNLCVSDLLASSMEHGEWIEADILEAGEKFEIYSPDDDGGRCPAFSFAPSLL